MLRVYCTTNYQVTFYLILSKSRFFNIWYNSANAEFLGCILSDEVKQLGRFTSLNEDLAQISGVFYFARL